MTILRAQQLGMCFGVRDAIAFAQAAAARHPLTILGELVHNEAVLADLQARGIRCRHHLDEVDTPTVMITAHGASRRRLAAARSRGLQVLDATCPLVRAAQRAVAELARDGFHPVVVGRRDHIEVLGLTEDLAAFDVVLNAADVLRLEPHDRFGIVAQTTQPVARVEHLAWLIRQRFPRAEVRLADTVCSATKHRQHAAAELAQRCDVVIVVGSTRSNNTLELVATCRSHGARVFQVQAPDDVREEWFHGARVAGLTAGASTPDPIIDLVEARLRNLAGGQLAA